jgi:hypothetical protein
MTWLRKRARLPRKMREDLNVHLAKGPQGKELVQWLKGPARSVGGAGGDNQKRD